MKKLRNKQTGETGDFMIHKYVGLSDEGNPVYAPFNGSIDEWEDVPEEPKEYWYLENDGDVDKTRYDGDDYDKRMKAIGNLFETEAEAELAVRKLKAWKRLKDKGFEFTNWEFKYVLDGSLVIEAGLNFDNDSNIQRDLEICFGGEE